MKNLILLVVLSIFTFSESAYSQSRVVFTEESSETYVFRNQQAQSQSGSQVYVNRIINLLGRGIQKPVNQIRFDVKVDYKLEYITSSGNIAEIALSIPEMSIAGDYLYKGFPIAEELKPSAIGAEVSLQGRGGESVFYEMRPIIFQGVPFQLSITEIPDTFTVRRLNLNRINLIYDNNSLGALSQRVQLIDAYYLSESQLYDVNRILKSIDPYNLEKIDENQQKLSQAELLLQQMSNWRFPRLLPLSSYDPVSYVPKFNAAGMQAAEVRNELQEVAGNLDKMYYDRGMQALNRSDFESAKSDFQRSLQFNPDASIVVFQYGLTQLAIGDTSDAITTLLRAEKMSHETMSIPRQINRALKDIYDGDIKTAEEKFQKGDLNDAYYYFDRALYVCNQSQQLACTQAAREGFSKTTEAIFTAFLSDKEAAMGKENYNEAKSILDEAKKFAGEHDISRGEARVADAEKKLHQNIFDEEVLRARRFVQNNAYEEAFEVLESAYSRQENYNIKVSEDWSQLTKKTAEEKVLALSNRGQSFLNQNDLRGAERILSDADRISKKYRIESKPEISEVLQDLNQNIVELVCQNASNTIDNLLTNANGYEAEKIFILARGELEKALKVAKENQNCALSRADIENRIEDIASAAIYQSKLMDAAKDITARRYSAAIEKYISAEQIFIENRLELKGIEHLNLNEYVEYRRNRQLSEATVQFHLNNSDYEEALSMIHFLADNRYSSATIRDLQRQLGKAFAQRDFFQTQPPQPRNKVSEYTEDKRRLRFLRRAYMRTWKSL
ncbi:MAG: hypothetical protein EA412_07290 [Chitinophagaceae bacterium]|nr:MAG: hypothetical protein EA412_07290 [Chitinophagaceae bacterium]